MFSAKSFRSWDDPGRGRARKSVSIAEIDGNGKNIPRINADDRGSEKPTSKLEWLGTNRATPLDLGMKRGGVSPFSIG